MSSSDVKFRMDTLIKMDGSDQRRMNSYFDSQP